MYFELDIISSSVGFLGKAGCSQPEENLDIFFLSLNIEISATSSYFFSVLRILVIYHPLSSEYSGNYLLIVLDCGPHVPHVFPLFYKSSLSAIQDKSCV